MIMIVLRCMVLAAAFLSSLILCACACVACQAVGDLTTELSTKTDDIETLKAQMADRNQVCCRWV